MPSQWTRCDDDTVPLEPVRDEDEGDDEPYDDSKDHTRCPDCKGSGYYQGLGVREHCKTCMGAGWI